MERTEERRVRPARPHRPADDAQPRHRRLPRQARAVRPQRAARRQHRSLLGRLEAGGAAPIADIGAPHTQRRRPRRARRRRGGHGLTSRAARAAPGRSVVAQEARDRRARRPGARTSRRGARVAGAERRLGRLGRAARDGSTEPRRAGVEAGRDHGHADVVADCSSTTAPKMMLAFWSAAPLHDLGRLVDLEQAEVAAARDVEQHAGRALDARLEQRRGDRRAGGLGGAVLARRPRRCPSARCRSRA